MYVHKGAHISSLIWRERLSILLLISMAVGTELIEPYISDLELFSVVYVGIFSAALSIFLVFRFNEAYERWWEARGLWGSLVNMSRSFARQTLALLSEEQSRAEGAGLVHRQIAFAHALRIHLREGDSAEGARQMEQVLRRILPAEAEELLTAGNIPNRILCVQSRRLADMPRGSTSESVAMVQFDSTFVRLHDVQGGCERIKNTAFPDAVSLVTRVLVWGLVLLLLLATIGPEGRGGVAATFAVCIMAMGYIWIDAMSRDLKDPFENRADDTPMTSLSVTIERDLREMLGETDLPAPVAPVDGVLM